ncbi:MAG TPA: CHASE sensor domain-containing protein, partial [Candidatus Sulfotelmatobacter sp.]|nr:CHASE sensor domain-containing protein [Candidatus Sulfotelmatobacter sp.]
MVLLLLTSFSGLLLVAVAIGLYEVGRVRHSMVHELSLQAELVAAASAAALAAEDGVAAQQALESLSVQPEITHARLFTAAGKLLAGYTRPKELSALQLPPPRQTQGHWFADGYLEVSRPSRMGAALVGTVSLRADLQEQRARLHAYASIGVVAIFLALLVALLLSLRLQNLVTRPILSLSRLAQAVTQRHDYSLRATKQTKDEVGLLVESFNRMLEHIQRSDAALRESEQRFREVTESIREVFWMYDWDHHHLLYVSPSYEEVWGRTSDSLYARPEAWLE